MIHSVMIRAEDLRLSARTFGGMDLAFSRDSSMTLVGIILMAIHIPSGKNKASSRYPITGIKSGIRSMGLIVMAMM